MPTLTGIFQQFKDIDLIPTTEIVVWVKHSQNIYYIENYIANLLVYPQIIPNTAEELDIELALLREILKRNPGYFSENEKKIYIPEEFTNRFPDITKLAWAFIDAYRPKNIFQLVLIKKTYKIILGTVINPEFKRQSEGMFDLMFDKKPNPSAQRIYNVRQDTLLVVPCVFPKITVNFKSEDATIFNEKEIGFEVAGGGAGIIVDGRINNESSR